MPTIKGSISEEKAKEIIISLYRKLALTRGMLLQMISEVVELTDHHPDMARQEQLFSEVLPDADDIMEATAFNLDEELGCEVDWDDEMGSGSEEERLALTQDVGGSNPSSPAKHIVEPATAKEIQDSLNISEEDREKARKILRDLHLTKDEE